MSQLFDTVKEYPFRFVIPTLGKCFKSRISRKDKALLIVFNKGYIETDDIFSCYYISTFLSTHKGNLFILVGNIDKVKRADGKVVYRQRVYFKSFVTFMTAMSKLNAYIVIPNDFYVSTDALTGVVKELPYLERYARKFKVSINKWLENICKVVIYEVCKDYKMCSKVNLTEKVLDIPKGYLDRAPMLCGSYNILTHTSSVITLCNRYDTDLFSGNSSANKLPYGYTDCNVEFDIKRGVF